MSTMKNRRSCMLLILIIGGLLRLYRLNNYGLWFDEAIELFNGQFLNFQNLNKLSLNLYNPPLHTLMMGILQRLDFGEYFLRLFPFAFGLMAIPMIYYIGKLLFNKNVGILSAFILSISPFHIYYSQELKAYSMTTLLVFISMYSTIQMLIKNKRSFWVIYVFSSIMAIYTQYLALFIIPAQNIYFFLHFRRYRKNLTLWSFAQLIILVSYLPWMNVLFGQIIRGEASGLSEWVPKGSIFEAIQLFKIFTVGYNAKALWVFIAFILFLGLGIFGIYRFRQYKKELILLLCWLIIPLILAKIFSRLSPVFLYRGLIFVSPAYYILVAGGINRLRKVSVTTFFIVIFLVLSFASLNNYYRNIYPYPEWPTRPGIHPKKETRTASLFLEKSFQKGDVILHTSRATAVPFLYYHKRQLDERMVTLSYQERYYHTYPRYVRLVGIEPVEVRDAIRDYKRVWLVLADWELGIYCPVSKEIENYFKENGTLLESRDFVGLKVLLYKGT